MGKRSHSAARGCALARVAVVAGSLAIGCIAWYGGPASAVAAPTFSISGSVDGLAPGMPAELTVTLGNPSGQPITVSQVGATAADASAGCPASNFVSLGDGGPLVVPSHGQSQQALPVTLAATAPVACQGQAFPLTFSGVGHSADPQRAVHHHPFAFVGGSARAALAAAATAVLGAGLTVLARRRGVGGMRPALTLF